MRVRSSNNQSPVAFPTGGEAVGLMVLLLALQLGCWLGVAATGIGIRAPVATAISNLLAFGTVCAIGVWWAGASLHHLFPVRSFSLRLIPPMSLTLLGACALVSEVGNIMRTAWPIPESIQQLFEQLLPSHGPDFWSVMLMLAVAPITEELLFRGLFLRGFLMNYQKATAVILSAFLFAVMHGNPWQFAASFGLGLLFGWWYIETRSLLPCIFGHALFNGVILAVSVAPFEIAGFTKPAPHQPIWLTILGLVAVLWGLYWTRGAFRR